MKRRWQIIFKSILFTLFTLQTFYVVYRTVDYVNHYPTLIGAYCFDKNSPLNYTENQDINNDELNIQKCSLTNIDACQHIQNQTLLFRLQWSSGLTSEFNNLIRAFIYAIHTHRRFLIDDQYWNYGSFSSFFNISKGRFSPWLPLSSYCLQRKFVHLINYKPNQKYIPEHLTVSRDVDGGFTSLNLLMKSMEKSNQTLQIKRIVADYLWKNLNNETRNYINQYINKIQLDNITYGLHIRQGDKLFFEAHKISIEKYLDGIQYFMNKYSRNESKPRIYVASDDYNIIKQLKNLKPNWEFVQFSQTYLPLNGHNQKKFNRLSINDKLELTRILLTDIEILSRVKYLVCTFSSNICRFIQILRKEDVDTVLSLDEKWYPA